jgi:transcriptional regulator with XRE-family HTH domain
LGKKNKRSTRTSEFDLLLDIIKRAREDANLSQREVAKRLEFHPTVFGKIERGERSIDVVEFVALSRAIGADPLVLLGSYLVAEQKARIEKVL